MQDVSPSLIHALLEEERNLNAEIETDVLRLCLSFTQRFLVWQEKSSTIRDLSFTSADITLACFSPLFQFLNADDGVPRKVKSELVATTLNAISMPFFEVSHKRISGKKIAEHAPSCHWESRRIRLRLQAYDILLSQFPLMHQVLAKMGYQHYIKKPSSLVIMQSLKVA